MIQAPSPARLPAAAPDDLTGILRMVIAEKNRLSVRDDSCGHGFRR
jgi:hypothetical protein